MLHCHIDIRKLTDSDLECGACDICKARSKLNYPFDKNLKSSDELVRALEVFIEANTGYKCERTKIDKNPDIVVVKIREKLILICRVEAKMLEGFAFMKAESILGDKLKPKETLVVDLPKLLHYFKCKEIDSIQRKRDIPIFIVWQFDRPCADLGGITVFQEITELKRIYDARGAARSFTRKTVESDINFGQKLGVTDKYHFSLRECRPIEEIVGLIKQIGRES